MTSTSDPSGAVPYSPRAISMSVPSMPTRITSTSTSPAWGTGSATSRTAPLPAFPGMTVRARIRAEYVAMTMEPGDVERVFREVGALRDGHFVLTSGRHSAIYLEKFRLLERPTETERLCTAIAAWARTLDVATVAGPTTGGVILAYEVARQLGVRAVYAERREDGGGRELRRGFAPAPGERVLVGGDVVTTGGSLQGTVAAAAGGGGPVAGAAGRVGRPR